MTDRELLQYNMTSEERAQWEAFSRIVTDKCSFMDTPPMDWDLLGQHLMAGRFYYGARGYSKEEGYYDVQEGDRGKIHVQMRTQSLDEAILEKLIEIAHDMSYGYVLKNRKVIDGAHQKKFHSYLEYGPIENGRCESKIIENSTWEYDAEYDYRKYWFELALSFLEKVLDRKQLDLEIVRYEGFMNHHFQEKFWCYDLQERKFMILKR